MGLSSFDDPCLAAVQRLVAADHLTIVVGAGASVAAGLPGWEDLVHQLLVKGRGAKAERVAALLQETQGFLLAAEAAFPPTASAGRRKQMVARALYGAEGRNGFIPSRLHQAVAALARLRGPEGLGVFTTNYDDLLERAFRDEGLRVKPRFAPQNPAHRGAFPIHHVHGYLGSETESDDIVLGQSDYARVAAAGSDWPAEELGSAAARGPVVFVGASLTDPNLLRILLRLREREYERHVLVLARQGLDVPWELAEAFRDRLARQWQRYNVEVVLLDDFSDVSLFVREVGAGREGLTESPRERVAALWARILGSFELLQQEFATALDEEFKGYLEGLLGPEANLALWLADGRGELALFASNDRLYRRPSALRRIPDRHDAGWILSQALSYETAAVGHPGPSASLGAAGPIDPVAGRGGPVSESRWGVVAATPLQPRLGGGSPVTVGALTAATVKRRPERFERLGEILARELAGEWEARLTTLWEWATDLEVGSPRSVV